MTVAVHPRTGPLRSYFDFSAKPGRRAAAGTLELRNRTGRRIVVLLDPVDAETATTFGSAYVVRGLPTHRQTRWTTLGRRRVTLPPHGRRLIKVAVHPPRSAAPGDYLSGIGVQAAAASKQKKLRSNVAVSSIERYAIGVLVRVSGPRVARVQLTGAKVDREPSGLTFSVLARNSGNVVLQNVAGSVKITRGSHVVATAPMGPGTFVSGTSIAYPVRAPREQPREGTVYRVRAVLRYAGRVARLDVLVRFGHGAAVRQANFGGPRAGKGGSSVWLLVLLAVALLAAAAAGGAAYVLRKRRPRPALPVLERALATARDRSEPLSLIRLSVLGGDSPNGLHALAGARIRRDDVVCRLSDSALVVVAPDTSVAAAEALAAELRRDLDRAEQPAHVAVKVFSLNGDRTAAELLARMAGPSDATAATIA